METLNGTTNEPTKTIPINAFCKANTKPDTLLLNIAREITKSNTAKLDYTKDATNNNPLNPLSKRFCDNIVLYYFIPQQDIENNEALLNWIKRKIGTNETTNGDINETTEDITDIVKPFLGLNTGKLVNVLSQVSIPINKPAIKPTKLAVINGRIAQMLKVSLPDLPLVNVLKLVCEKETKDILEFNGFYINDIDITQDFMGVINKEQVINYLIEEKDYIKEGEGTNGHNIILNNNNTVSSHCLSFLRHTPEATIRYKFYNKFIQSLESPSVRRQVGNHIADWINNPELILRNSISKCLDYGLLRLEITFYLKQPTLTKEFIEQHMDYLQQLLPPELIYYQPISKQWQIYNSVITSNLCIVDLDNKLALLVYAIDREINKINGEYYKDITDNKLSNILKLYTYNTPIYLVKFKRDGNNLLIFTDIFIKQLESNNKLNYLPTYINIKKHKDNNEEPLSPQQMGLIDLPNINPTKAPTINLTTKQTKNIPITLTKIEWEPLDFPTTSKHKRAKIKATEEEEQQLKQKYEQQLKQIVEDNNMRQQQYQQQLKQKQDIEPIINLFEEHNTYSLTTLETNTKLYIYAWKHIKTRYGPTVLMAANIEPNTNNLKLYWGNKRINDYINSNKWNIINKNIVATTTTNKPILEITINGFYYSESRNKCVAVAIRRYGETIKENQELIKDEVLKPTRTIEEFIKEGNVVKIIAAYPFRKSFAIKCSINDEEPIVVKSNRFLDELLENKTNKFSVLVSVRKLHPTLRKKLYSFIDC